MLFAHHSGDRVRKDDVSGPCSMHCDMRNSEKVHVLKSKRKRSHGRPTWVHSIKRGLKERGRKGVNCVHLAEKKAGSYEQGNEASSSIQGREIPGRPIIDTILFRLGGRSLI